MARLLRAIVDGRREVVGDHGCDRESTTVDELQGLLVSGAANLRDRERFQSLLAGLCEGVPDLPPWLSALVECFESIDLEPVGSPDVAESFAPLRSFADSIRRALDERSDDAHCELADDDEPMIDVVGPVAVLGLRQLLALADSEATKDDAVGLAWVLWLEVAMRGVLREIDRLQGRVNQAKRVPGPTRRAGLLDLILRAAAGRRCAPTIDTLWEWLAALADDDARLDGLEPRLDRLEVFADRLVAHPLDGPPKTWLRKTVWDRARGDFVARQRSPRRGAAGKR